MRGRGARLIESWAAVQCRVRDARGFDAAKAGFWAHPTSWMLNAWGRFDRARSFGLAAEMAFWLFLSLLPLAAVAGLVVARFAMHDGAAMSGVMSSLPPAVRELLSKELASVSAWNEGAVAPAAAATFVWLASSNVHTIFDSLELETKATARPW